MNSTSALHTSIQAVTPVLISAMSLSPSSRLLPTRLRIRWRHGVAAVFRGDYGRDVSRVFRAVVESGETWIWPRRATSIRAREARSIRRARILECPLRTTHCAGRTGLSLDSISIRGAREHNLKGFDLEIPRDKLVVITGLSGSGKSSLAFDTIYAEGQRRYVESLSAYARQFLGQMDKPDVDHIEGLSPAVSIDQKTTSQEPALDRGHRHRDLRLPAPALRAHRHPALPDLRAAHRAADLRSDRRPHPRAGRGHQVPGARAGREGAQGRVRQAARRPQARGLHPRARGQGGPRARRGDRARQEVQARHRRGRSTGSS